MRAHNFGYYTTTVLCWLGTICTLAFFVVGVVKVFPITSDSIATSMPYMFVAIASQVVSLVSAFKRSRTVKVEVL
jgi:hypothetical protein